jgi:hypothetical protein
MKKRSAQTDKEGELMFDPNPQMSKANSKWTVSSPMIGKNQNMNKIEIIDKVSDHNQRSEFRH